MKPLEGKTALVAGATRGAGRAIALELALAGATVYATGRSRGPRPERGGAFELARRPETIDETEAIIRAAGGLAHARQVDHRDPAQVAALVAEIGPLDVLVDSVWGGEELIDWGKPLHETDLEQGLRLLEQAVVTHVITARAALPGLLERQGLIVQLTDGAGHFYRSHVFYDLVKTSVIRLAFALAEEHAGKLTSVAVTPGFLRSEAMLDHLGVSEARWRDAIAQDEHFAFSETPRFVARGIAALAADPGRQALSGRGFASWQLARRYGVTDLDGSQPDWGRHAAGEGFGRAQAESSRRFLDMFEG